MNTDTISREKLLQEIHRLRNQSVIGKTEARRWEKIVESFPSEDDPITTQLDIGRLRKEGDLYARQ